MFVVGFALGMLFGWLSAQTAGALAGLQNEIKKRPCLAGALRVLAWLLLLSVFAGGVYVVIFADYDVDNRYLPEPVVRAFHFIIALRQLKSLLAFLLGWFCFVYRKPLLEFACGLGERLTERQKPRGLGQRAPSEPTSPTYKPAGDSHVWLTRSVAIALVSAVVLIVLVVMQPEIFARLVSFKLGDVIEANFTAAAEHSVRVNAPTFGGALTARLLLERGTELPEVIHDVFTPVSNKLNAPNTGVITQQNDAFLFLEAFAVPLAQVVTCYLKEFPVGDTAVLHDAVDIADRWRRLATKEDEADKFAPLAHASDELIKQMENKIPGGHFVYGDYIPYTPIETGCDRRKIHLDTDPIITLQNHPGFLNDGMVISFISNLVAFTQDWPTAANFLENMDMLNAKGAGLATGDDALGRFTFYANRAATKYFAKWYPEESIKNDFDDALSDVDAILAKISKPSDNNATVDVPTQYFEAERARLINNRIYYLLNETLQGRPLRPAEVDEVKALTGQLKKWVLAQNAVRAVARPSNITELIAKRRAGLIPPFYDTLATEQIVMAQLAGRPTEQECTQIRIYLEKAQDLYSELARQLAQDHRDDFKIIEARRNMYESICSAGGRG